MQIHALHVLMTAAYLRLFALVVVDMLHADDAAGDARPAQVVHSKRCAALVLIRHEGESPGLACIRRGRSFA